MPCSQSPQKDSWHWWWLVKSYSNSFIESSTLRKASTKAGQVPCWQKKAEKELYNDKNQVRASTAGGELNPTRLLWWQAVPAGKPQRYKISNSSLQANNDTWANCFLSPDSLRTQAACNLHLPPIPWARSSGIDTDVLIQVSGSQCYHLCC